MEEQKIEDSKNVDEKNDSKKAKRKIIFWVSGLVGLIVILFILFFFVLPKPSEIEWLSNQMIALYIAIGLLAYTIISLSYTLASNIYQLTSIRMLHGAASCMVIPIAKAYIGDLIPEGKEGTFINLFSMSMFLGMGAGPFLGGV